MTGISLDPDGAEAPLANMVDGDSRLLAGT
jgi:hypothetical protein